MVKGLIAAAFIVVGIIFVDSKLKGIRYYVPEFETFSLDRSQIEIQDIQGFNDQGLILEIIVDTFLKPKNNTIWLSGYSRSPNQNVYVHHVELLTNGNRRLKNEIEKEFQTSVKMGGVDVFYFNEAVIEGISRRQFEWWPKPITILVKYSVNGHEKTLEYKLRRGTVRIGMP